MQKLIVLAGTNASGKSGLGIELAGRFKGEVVSADSRQVYKGLDLGSGKVTKEEMKGIPHHLIDVVPPDTFFTLLDFQDMAYEAIDDIGGRGRLPFLVGGTGLYVNSVVDGYNITREKPDLALREELSRKSIEELKELLSVKAPELLAKTDPNNFQRLERAAERALSGDTKERKNTPRYETLFLGVTWHRPELYERIRLRLNARIEAGMIDEVRLLREGGVSDEFLYRLGLEYRYILMYLRGEFTDFDSFYNKLFMEIRHLAKEQMTWFRKRKDVRWIDMTNKPFEEASALIDEFLSDFKEEK